MSRNQSRQIRTTQPAAEREDLDSLSPVSPAAVVQRSLADPGSLTPGDVKILQRTVGNRATLHLLDPVVRRQPKTGAAPGITHHEERNAVSIRRVPLAAPPASSAPVPKKTWQRPSTAPGSAPAAIQSPKTRTDPGRIQRTGEPLIQRTLLRHKPKAALQTDVEKQAETQAQVVDNAVTKAFDEFKAGDYAGASDAQISLYVLRKQQYDSGNRTIHPSTASGYVIEGKVNTELKQKGFNLQVTDLLQGTRPDIVFSLPGDMYGLVDITASESAGHIFKKKGNWTGHQNIPYVAESVYPSINFNDPSATADLTPDQIEQANQRALESAELQEYIKQEIAADQERKFNIWQDTVVEQFEHYAAIAARFRGGINWRISSREQGAWRDIGLEVDVNEAEGRWQVTNRLNYTDWKQAHPHERVSRSDFDKVIKQIDGKGKQKNDREYYPGFLPFLDDQKDDRGAGGGARLPSRRGWVARGPYDRPPDYQGRGGGRNNRRNDDY